MTQNLVQPGEKKIYIENNRARSVHFKDQNGNPLVIDGQLSVSEAGPFLVVSENVLNGLYTVHGLFDQKIAGTNKTVLAKLSETEFRQHWVEYQKRARILEAEYARKESGSGKHADGTSDEIDREWDSFKVNYKVSR